MSGDASLAISPGRGIHVREPRARGDPRAIRGPRKLATSVIWIAHAQHRARLRGRLLRWSFARLGATFVKIGQSRARVPTCSLPA